MVIKKMRRSDPVARFGTKTHFWYCDLLALSLNTSAMVVCICNAIRECEVRKAAREGASCPASAYASIGRKPRCGQCFPFARQLISAERAPA